MQQILAVMGFLVLAAGCQAQDPTGQIACNRGGQIMLLDVGSGEQTVLVADNTYDRPLYWLPSGERLVYWNHDGGAWDLWAIAPEGRKATNLTGTARDNRSPCASPDGSRIAFHRGGDGVWLMDANGKNQRRIHELGHRDIAPVWAPSGKRLVFCHLARAGERRVKVMLHLVEFDGGEPTTDRDLGRGETGFFLSENELVVTAPHEGRRELVVVEVDSGERRALTRSEAADYNPVLSPDRRRIVWVEDGEPSDKLKVMNVDGTGVRELCEIANWYAPPSFSPDGGFVAFESGNKRGATQVHIVSIANGDKRTLTTEGGSFPVWRPAK